MADRTLVIGDIHGCDFALNTALQLAVPTEHDRLIVLGDMVDRGAGSKQVIDLLIYLSQQMEVIVIQGNHEEMMLNARTDDGWRESWLQYGGTNTLCSYGGGLNRVPDEHWAFLEATKDYFETEHAVFVHANLCPDFPLERQDREWLRWTHLSGDEVPLPDGRLVVCGHTPQKSGSPLAQNGWVDIDTFAYGSGWLSILELETGRVFQANERRESRELQLNLRPEE